MFARRVAQVASKNLGGVRRMGGHHHEHPKDGLDGFIRKYLPEDQHVVLGILGIYTSLYFLTKLTSGKKKAVENAEQSTSTASANGEVPSIDSPEFDSWVSTPGNVEKLFA